MNLSLVESLIPLYFVQLSGGVLKGETRLQKLMFVAQNRLRHVDYDFEKAWYGPYSARLSGIMRNLASLGLLEIKTGKTRAGYGVTEYNMTSDGKALLKYASQRRILHRQLAQKLRETYDEYGKLGLMDLLKRVYAEYPQWVTKSVLIKR